MQIQTKRRFWCPLSIARELVGSLTTGTTTSASMEYRGRFRSHIPRLKLGCARWETFGPLNSTAMFWKRSYFSPPGFHLKPVVLQYSFIVVILSSWRSYVPCRDGMGNSVGSLAPSATNLTDAESLLRGSSARSIAPAGGSVTFRLAVTATGRPATMPTNQPFTTLICYPNSGGKGSWPLGSVADASDVCSNISSIGTTLAPHLCQASHCRRSSSTATATHRTVPEGLQRLGQPISTMGRSREPRRSRDRGRRSRPRDNASDPGSAASSKGDGRNPNAPWLYGAWVKQKDRVSELETELK